MKPSFEWRDEEIYLDNAATTIIDPEVVEAMQPYVEERYGNPETVYQLGREAHSAVEEARHRIAEQLGCFDDEVYFTSGGTESNNWAIKGIRATGRIVSAVEHASVLEPAKWMCMNAPYYEVTVDEYGMVRLDELETELKTGKYALVSIQYANNEVGTIQPVKEIATLCQKYKALFHCDAVQAFGKVAFDVDDMGFDMASLSAHKIHGPMGVGALYVRRGTPLEPLMHGGGQERGMRSGTLAVHQIVGFGKAVEIAGVSIKRDMPGIFEIVEATAKDMALSLNARRNGHPTQRLPNILNVTIPGLDMSLACGLLSSKYGICVSSGSACHTRSRMSHVLWAMGRKSETHSALRISLSKYNTREDMMMLISRLQAVLMEKSKRDLL